MTKKKFTDIFIGLERKQVISLILLILTIGMDVYFYQSTRLTPNLYYTNVSLEDGSVVEKEAVLYSVNDYVPKSNIDPTISFVHIALILIMLFYIFSKEVDEGEYTIDEVKKILDDYVRHEEVLDDNYEIENFLKRNWISGESHPKSWHFIIQLRFLPTNKQPYRKLFFVNCLTGNVEGNIETEFPLDDDQKMRWNKYYDVRVVPFDVWSENKIGLRGLSKKGGKK